MVAIFTGAGIGLERGSVKTLGGIGTVGSSGVGRSGEQAFVNGANGNLVITQRDEFLVGRGLDAVISRTYNSQGLGDDDNGDNWRQSSDRRLYGLTGAINAAGSTITRVAGDGSAIVYSFDGGRYVSTQDADATDTIRYDGTWRWTDGKTNVVETYGYAHNGEQYISQQSDTNGNAITFSYDASRLTRVTTADGGYIRYDWSGNNIVAVATVAADPISGATITSTRTRYGYDTHNRLTSVTVDLTPEDNSIADGRIYTTSYSYVGTSKLIASITETDQSRVEFDYQTIQGADREYQGVTEIRQYVDHGAPRTMSIGYAGLPSYAEDYTSVRTLITNPPGQTTRLEFDREGKLRAIFPPSQAGVEYSDEEFPRDVYQFSWGSYAGARGRLDAITDPNGKTTSYTYDDRNNVVAIIDRVGSTTSRTYDAGNRLLTESVIGADATSAAAIHTSRNAYDAAGNLRFSISAGGSVTENRFDGFGQLNRQIIYALRYDTTGLAADAAPSEQQMIAWAQGLNDKSGVGTDFTYDARGNVMQQVNRDFIASGAADDTIYNVTTFVYDQAGQLLQRHQANTNVEHFAYDGLGRLIASVDLNGAHTSIVFEDAHARTIVSHANGYQEVSSYNRAGDLLAFAETGPQVSDRVTAYQYDASGRATIASTELGDTYQFFDHDGRKVADIDSDGRVVEYRYDLDGRLIGTVRRAALMGSDELAAFSDPHLDDSNDFASFTPGDAPGDVWTWQVYDGEGRIAQAIDGTGATTSYTYDQSGRLIDSRGYANPLAPNVVQGFRTTPPHTVVLPILDDVRDRVARSFYDKDGLSIGTLDGEGYLVTRSYDSAGRLMAVTELANPTDPALRASATLTQLAAGTPASASDRTTRYTYDAIGQLVFTLDPIGHVVENRYLAASGDPASGIGEVRQMISYAGTIITADASIQGIRAALTQAGLTDHPENRRSFVVYDAAGRPAYTVDPTGAVIRRSYDSEGRIVESAQYSVPRPTTSTPTLAEMDAWVVDSAAITDRIERTVYAADGNVIARIDPESGVLRYTYDLANNLTNVDRLAALMPNGIDLDTLSGQIAIESTSFTYDPSGRVIAKHIDGTRYVYAYSATGDLVSETVAAGTPAAVTTAFEYDGAGRIIVRRAAVGTVSEVVNRTTYDAFGSALVETDGRGATTRFTYDERGQLLTRTDAAGGVTSFGYDAFGDTVTTTDARGFTSYDYFDVGGRLVVNRDAENYVTEFAYNAFAEVSATTRRFNRAANTPGAGTSPQVSSDIRDATTLFSYDRLGRVVTTTDAEGYVETTSRNTFGDTTRVQNKLGGFTDYAYDRRGLLLSEYVAAPVYDGLGQLTSGGYYRHVYAYDSRGNVLTDVEAHGLPEQRTTVFTYDSEGRLASRSGDAVMVGLPGQKHLVTPTETYAYDQRGNLLLTVDATGARTQSYYDDLDRLVAQVRSIGDVASGMGAVSTFVYDANGNVVTSRSYDDAIPLPPVGGLPPVLVGGYRETTRVYDGLNRLTNTATAGVRTGSWNGTQYTTAIGSVVTTLEYDARGNVVRSTDGRGGSTLSYFDGNGRQTAQVDNGGFLTTWTLDAEGNVLSERRSAAQTLGATAAVVPAPTPDDTADRVTDFTYDRNGRRLTEVRRGVQFWSVDAATGVLSSGQASATIAYSYNGLGEVTRRAEATGDYVDYTYDSMGRLTHEARTPFIDQSGGSVRPTVDYAYDGLGDLVRTVESGTRITSHTYATGGRLESSTDAVGNTRSYHYDAVGRKVAETYVRSDASGFATTEGITYDYDSAGQLTRQGYTTLTEGQWISIGSATGAHYNSHGEVITRSINGNVQERFDYDNAGRIWRSNADDGSWRYYVYDASGNRTYMAESNGQNLRDFTLEQVLGIDPQISLGGGKVETYYVYDARNQATATIMPERQIDTGVDTLFVSRAYNAFGEMISETDAAGYLTSYSYNALGRRLVVTRPQVQVTDEQGVTTLANPIERYFFDIGGRLVGTADANGNVVTRMLQAGTGYGQATALVATEWHPDGGVIRNGYDVFGNLTTMTDEVGQQTTMGYDALGRLTQMVRSDGYTDGYAYDVLGQRISHSNTAFATTETTAYDVLGRVTSTTSFGGDVTSTVYVWDPTLAVMFLGTQGGWHEVTFAANGRSATTSTDAFDHIISRTDLGGHVFSYSYDAAGRLITRRTGDEELGYIYLNTGLVSFVGVGRGDGYTPGSDLTTTGYGYDRRGYKVSESTVHSTVTQYVDEYGQTQNRSTSEKLQGATVSYDALGRMTSWNDLIGRQNAPDDGPSNRIEWQYDAAGNVRHAAITFNTIDQDGSFVAGGMQDQWFRYDAMNRVVTDKGTLRDGQIVRGDYGTDFTYDAAGRRATAISTVGLDAPELPFGVYQGDRRDTYAYGVGGQLSSVTIDATGYTIGEDGFARSNGIYERPQGNSTFAYDSAGRLTRQIDSDVFGVAYDRSVVYNEKGQATSEAISQRQGGDTITTNITTDYGTGTSYALGSPVVVTSTSSRNNQAATTSQTVYGYEYFDSPLQSTISFQPDVTQSTVYTTAISYTGQGVLSQAVINDGRPRTVTYQADVLGQVLRRDEVDGNTAAGDPHEIWFRFNGRELGRVGNNGTTRTDYATSVADRTQPETTGTSAGAFRHGNYFGISVAEFGGAQPINSYNQGADGGSYTVRNGDTLASIAEAVWGDSSLWYRLAQANGLGADNQLIEGQVLTIPRGVLRSGNSASTFDPYDPAAVIGDITPDTSPTNPQPQARGSRNRCGAFGTILLVAVALAVTAVTYGALTAPAVAATATTAGSAGGLLAGAGVGNAIAAGAIASAAGSIASQGVGLATGLQNRFSFGSVALAALSGGVGGGLGAVPGLNGASGIAGVVQDVGRGIIGSALTQGVSVVTGLQSKFSFAGVAVGGVVSGVSGAINLPGRSGRIVAGTAASIAGAATRSLIEGSSFGDNLLAVLPEVIGATIGGLVADGLARRPEPAMRTTPLRGSGGGLSMLAAVTAGIDLQGDGRIVATNIAMQEPDIVVIGRRPNETSLLDDLVNGVGGFIDDLLSIRVSIGQSSFRVDAGENNIINATANGLSVLNGSLVANRNSVALRTNFVRATASSRGISVGAGRFTAAATTSGDAFVRAGNSGLAIVGGGVVARVGSAGLARSSDGSVTRITLPGARVLQGNGFTRVTVGGASLTRTDGFIGLQAAKGPGFASLRAQVGSLRNLGVDKAGQRAFLNGEVVSFETRSASGGVYGLIQNADGKLTSQLFSIADQSPASAVRGFIKFRNDSIALARATGVDTLELQGGSVINPRVAKFLTDQGFASKSAPVPAALGGGYQDVMYKVIRVR